ncbi:HAD-like domain protein [Kalmanozyma brasiliensis GHG001]|uniref:Haloacid dehalogenase n=1 Tax=Kalmanozyma brasiliensis (strain GHG001) TaxID=1365824 RepID=V5EU34_KALBG|nr:HAD-like domain protein [Kalmanozyma brasiliensis GHG001]EST05559.1 HAD-like domain protein [Kalmanozyma brasiliensis GHG001]
MSVDAKAKLAKVEVLYFDVFGTVVDYVETVTRALRHEIAYTSLPDPVLKALRHDYDWQRFTIKWREQYKLETARLASSGNPDRITVDQMHMTALNKLVSALPLPDPTGTIGELPVEEVSKALDEAWGQEVRERLNFTWHLLDPWPDSVQGLNELKQRFKIGTLTNGNLNLMVDMARNGKLPWDFLCTADMLGSFKPDPQMYRKAMQLFEIQPDVDGGRACMVAAHLYDLEAAKACGMTTVFVSSRPTEDSLPADGKPDYVDIVVADLLELAQLIS